MPVEAMVMSLSASSVQAAATMALVDGIAGMMFFVTPCVSWYVTPCARTRVVGRRSVPGRRVYFGEFSTALPLQRPRGGTVQMPVVQAGL